MKSGCILFFLLISLSVGAQEGIHYTNVSLSTVLSELEIHFDVKFSYNARAIANKTVSIATDTVTLKDILSQIEKNTKVIFEQIDERYYILKSNNAITFCGYLKDELNGNPIEGASIVNTAKEIGAVSDKSGFFELRNNNETDTLSISFIGYKTIELHIGITQDEPCQTYMLSSENYVLNEVVVQEYLAAGFTKLKDGSIKINTNNLDILSGLSEPDILQNIQLLPGIESPSETVSGLYIRGGSPDQNLILWDGIKMYNSDHFFGTISAFNPYITDQVKVYRSGTRPEYGDRVSGVIDITTDNRIPAKIEGGGGINMTHIDAYLKVPLSKKIGIIVSARRSITDIIETPAFNNFAEKVFQNTSIVENQNVFLPEFSETTESFYFTDVTLKAIVKLSEKDDITVSNLFTRNKLDYSFSDTTFDIFSSDKLNIQNIGSNWLWNRAWSDTFSSEAQFYISEYDLKYTGENRFSEVDISTIKENNVKELGASFKTDWNIGETITLSNGYQFFSNQVAFSLGDESSIESDNQKSATHSLYSQLNYDKPESWYIDLGLRASYYQGVNSLFIEPRVYLERRFGEHFRLKGSAEIKNQAISQIIEFTTLDFGLENQVWALSQNDGFPILKSNQFSTGFLYTNRGLNIDVDAYYKKISGLTSLTRGFESAENNFSEGTSTSKGIDVLLKKKINGYSTWLGYTYSITDFVFDGLNQGNVFRGNNDITHSLTWSHSYKWKDFQFSLGWKYRTGIPYTIARGTFTNNNNAFIDYGAINSATLPDYHRLDFSILYDFKMSKKNNSTKAKLGFSLLNLYNRKNLLSRNYILFTEIGDTDVIELREINKFSLGLTPNVVFRLNF